MSYGTTPNGISSAASGASPTGSASGAGRMRGRFSPPDSPASPRRWRVSGWRRRTRAGSGPRSSGWFAAYDPRSCSWKIPQGSWFADLETFSGTWPRQGTMRAGVCWPQPMWAHPTAGTGCGWWPTPKAAAAHYGRPRPQDRGDLQATVLLWPTPQAHDSQGPRWAQNTFSAHHHAPHDLVTAVTRWPTPKATPSGPDYARGGRSGSGGDDLATAVAGGWPTPAARDYRSPNRNGNQADQLPNVVGSRLNPDWVECLMGYPVGWTVIDGPQAGGLPKRRGSRRAPQRASPTASPGSRP